MPANLNYHTGLFGFGTNGLVPVASANDVLTIVAGPGRITKVHRVIFSGGAGALIFVNINAILRGAADSGGTATNPPIIPLGATVPTALPVASTVVSAYTANPTPGSPFIGSIGSIRLPLVDGSASNTGPRPWDFDWRMSPVVLGPGMNLAFNFGSVTITTGNFSILGVISEE